MFVAAATLRLGSDLLSYYGALSVQSVINYIQEEISSNMIKRNIIIIQQLALFSSYFLNNQAKIWPCPVTCLKSLVEVVFA